MYIFLFTILISFTLTHAQEKTSVLNLPFNIQQAYNSGTRSPDGTPGPSYWQNKADYDIRVTFDPSTLLLTGSEKIIYYNQSPDTLSQLVFHLFADLYKIGNPRDFIVDEDDITSGIHIERFSFNGNSIQINDPSSPVQFTNTEMKIELAYPLLPKAEGIIEIDWNYTLNAKSHMRTGQVHDGSFFIAYFFPRVAVYDDIDGWNETAYTGNVEFYNDFGRFDLQVIVPKNFSVWATGLLQNPEEVLQTPFLKKYKQAIASDSIVSIINADECNSKKVTAQNRQNTWIYSADMVSDVAFAVSDHYLWDGCSILVDPVSGRKTFLDVAYDRGSADFYEVAAIARKSIIYMSNSFPAYPFPFPAITIYDGSDGMEYPMMVNNTSQSDRDATVKLTVHEVLHSYQPFLTGMNETKYAWMDEGLTSFGDYLIIRAIDSPRRPGYYYLDSYRVKTGMDTELPLSVISHTLRKPVYTFNSYPKAAAFFMTLYDLLGADLYIKTYRDFIERWKYKHPTPYDLFNTFENSTGQSLTWLVQSWFFEFAYVDLELVREKNDTATESNLPASVIVYNKGGLPVPVHVKITYDNGKEKILKNPASVWQHNPDNFILAIPQHKKVQSIKLLNPTLIDADTSGHTY